MTSQGQEILALDSNIWTLLLIWLLEVTTKKPYLAVFSHFFLLEFSTHLLSSNSSVIIHVLTTFTSNSHLSNEENNTSLKHVKSIKDDA